MTTKIRSLGFFPGLLFSMEYDQATVLIKLCVADIKSQLDLANIPTFIAGESNRYSASSLTYLTKSEISNSEVPLSWHNVMLSPQWSLKDNTRRFLTGRNNAPMRLNTLTTEHVLLWCLH